MDNLSFSNLLNTQGIEIKLLIIRNNEHIKNGCITLSSKRITFAVWKTHDITKIPTAYLYDKKKDTNNIPNKIYPKSVISIVNQHQHLHIKKLIKNLNIKKQQINLTELQS